MVKMIARTELKFGEDCATIALPASATIFGLRGSTVAPEDAKGFLVVYNIQPLAPPHAKRQTAVVGIETRGGVAGGSAKARPKSAPPFLRRKDGQTSPGPNGEKNKKRITRQKDHPHLQTIPDPHP